MPQGCKARPERVIIFAVSAWDANCAQHIPLRFEAAALIARDRRIAELEAELAQLRVRVSQKLWGIFASKH
jgi:predicted pyridoxine 5'-phosphate oxidase superfamily flavin-nucleotide-binding protein